jgi:small subunit ribosomal protein S7
MPPPLNMCSFARAIPLRPRPQAQWLRPVVRMSSPQLRTYSDSKEPLAADRSKRIDSQPLPHVSEEAATMAEITGGEGPDLSQGTPIEEVGRVGLRAVRQETDCCAGPSER